MSYAELPRNENEAYGVENTTEGDKNEEFDRMKKQGKQTNMN